MPAKCFPISAEAIAAAARFIRVGRRSYRRAGEPAHPSLRQVVAHLVGRGLVDPKAPPPPVTLGRALKRAGVVMPPHWRSGPERQVGAAPNLCSSVDDGGTTRTAHRPPLNHPWRRPPRRVREPNISKTCSEHLPGRPLGEVVGAAP